MYHLKPISQRGKLRSQWKVEAILGMIGLIILYFSAFFREDKSTIDYQFDAHREEVPLCVETG